MTYIPGYLEQNVHIVDGELVTSDEPTPEEAQQQIEDQQKEIGNADS